MPDSPTAALALQARIQAARQRLRTAQVSLLESLEQVSPSSSPSYSPNPIRQASATETHIDSPLSSKSDPPAAPPAIVAVAGSGCMAATAAVSGLAASAAACGGFCGGSGGGSPCGSKPATTAGPGAAPAAHAELADASNRARGAAVDAAAVRKALLQHAAAMEDGDEGWSDDVGSSSSGSDDEADGEADGGGEAEGERAAEGGASETGEAAAEGKAGTDPDVVPKSIAEVVGVARAAGLLPPPRELFNFGAHYGQAGGTAGESTDSPSAGAPPPRMRTGYPVLHPPPVHIADEPPLPEPLRPNPKLEELVASLMAADAERLANPSLALSRVAYDAFDPIDLASNVFVRDDCLNTLLPAIDAPLGEGAAPLMGAPAAAPAAGADLDEASAVAKAAHGATAKPPSVGFDKGSLVGVSPPKSAVSRGVVRSPRHRDMLVFESRFESGNLRRAVQVASHEYDLILRPDLNTRGNTQWFYFAFANGQRGVTYKFNILNMVKPDSLFNFGMQPLVYSTQEAALRATGWRRRGHDVCYYQNHIRRRTGYYYTLSFKLRVLHASDVTYVAYTHPYTYTDLNRYLQGLEMDASAAKRFRRRALCETLSGNTVDMLTITSFASDPEAIAKRKGIVISARVHPGETNASFMMQGLIDYLVGPSLDAKTLRDNFVFKIVPMLNPDGVVVGNYRTSLAGLDLNRMWRDPSRRVTPSIYAIKMMIRRLQEDRDVVLFCDLHGHSRKHNVFCYGCAHDSRSETKAANRYAEMIFPRLLWRNSSVFSFSDCSFKVQRAKESTARVVVRRELGIVNSFTLEATLAGPNFGRLAGTHLTPSPLRDVGHAFCDTILDYFDPDPAKREAVTEELRMLYPHGFIGDGNDSDGSDANPDEDCLDQDLGELEKEMRRKKVALKNLAQKARRARRAANRGNEKGRENLDRERRTSLKMEKLTKMARIAAHMNAPSASAAKGPKVTPANGAHLPATAGSTSTAGGGGSATVCGPPASGSGAARGGPASVLSKPTSRVVTPRGTQPLIKPTAPPNGKSQAGVAGAPAAVGSGIAVKIAATSQLITPFAEAAIESGSNGNSASSASNGSKRTMPTRPRSSPASPGPGPACAVGGLENILVSGSGASNAISTLKRSERGRTASAEGMGGGHAAEPPSPTTSPGHHVVSSTGSSGCASSGNSSCTSSFRRSRRPSASLGVSGSPPNAKEDALSCLSAEQHSLALEAKIAQQQALLREQLQQFPTAGRAAASGGAAHDGVTGLDPSHRGRSAPSGQPAGRSGAGLDDLWRCGLACGTGLSSALGIAAPSAGCFGSAGTTLGGGLGITTLGSGLGGIGLQEAAAAHLRADVRAASNGFGVGRKGGQELRREVGTWEDGLRGSVDSGPSVPASRRGSCSQGGPSAVAAAGAAAGVGAATNAETAQPPFRLRARSLTPDEQSHRAAPGLAAGADQLRKPPAENALRQRYTDAAFGASTLSQPSLPQRHHAVNTLLGGRPWQGR